MVIIYFDTSEVSLYMTRYVVNLSYQNFKKEERL